MKIHYAYIRCWLKFTSSTKLFVSFLIWIIIFYQYLLPRILGNYIGGAVFRGNGHIKNFSFKYILLWEHHDFYPFYIFTQKDIFTKNNCSYQNCIVTTDRNYFNGNLTGFDAIAFNGRFHFSYKNNFNSISRKDLKLLNQKYIYVNTESAANNPVAGSEYDNLFNWTLSYKLNSDVPYPYIQIRDMKGNVVGPKRDMHWKKNMTDLDDDLINRLKYKTRSVAWLVSNCKTKSKREAVVLSVKRELVKRGHKIDIYGACGTLKCFSDDDCNKRFEEYYFYLAFENSLAEDYVTEKLLRALRLYMVPVVYGGANYSRFLPPGSYLDARCTPANRLASQMIRLIENPHLYRQFFTWRKHYTYHYPMDTDNSCGVCQALNDPNLMRVTEYPDFSSWWNTSPAKCDRTSLFTS